MEIFRGVVFTCLISTAKPELTQDRHSPQIWAEDADAALIEQKQRLDAMGKEDASYQEALQQYQIRHNMLIMSSRYTNAARLRYAYALTASCQPMILYQGLFLMYRPDTDNPATDSYFRWLYTATTCTSDALQILIIQT